MKTGSGDQRATNIVFNVFTATEKGTNYALNPSPLLLPSFNVDDLPATDQGGDEAQTKTAPKHRNGKGCQVLPKVRRLLSSQRNWYSIRDPSDYYFPGVFKHEYPQRLGFCYDITNLSQYTSSDPHFLFHDIQLGKDKMRSKRRIKVDIDGLEEEVFYLIAPCKGVKYCGAHETGCDYVTSTRESRPCENHPQLPLIRSEPCSVEFVYIWPINEKDPRRWLTGIRRGDEAEDNNLHSHQLHCASKIPMRVQNDIKEAVAKNPHLKPDDLVVGELYVCTYNCYLHTLQSS